MIQTEYFIKRQDTKKSSPIALSVLRTEPDNPADVKFVVQIIHGFYDRKERYLPLMNAIADAGGMAVIHDMRGFGNTVRSADELGDTGDLGYNYEILCGDINAVYASIREIPDNGEMIECRYLPEIDTPEVPRYLLGFSYGALITSIFLSKDTSSAAGAVLAGLPHREAMIFSKRLSLGIRSLFTGDIAKPQSLSRRMTQRYSVGYTDPSSVDRRLAWYIRDPYIRNELIQDPICCHSKTVGSYMTRMKLLCDTYRPSSYNKPRRNFPVLILAGEFDPEAGGDKKVLDSAKFLEDMGFAPVEVKMFRGMLHDIFHETGCENVSSAVISFFKDHLDAENARLDEISGEYSQQFDTGGSKD